MAWTSKPNRKKEFEMVDLKLISESVFLQSRIDRDKKQIHDISILGNYSQNEGGREYSREALESAVKVLEGKPAYYTHQIDRKTGRILKGELIGNFTGLRIEGNRVKGTLNVLEKEFPFVSEIAERMPGVAGFSIDATARYKRKASGGELIESLVDGKSIDLVDNPATVKGLFESIESGEKIDMDELKKLQEELAQTKSELKKIREEKETEETKTLQEELEKTKQELKKIQEEKAQQEKEMLVLKKIQESKVSVSDVFKKQLLSAPDEMTMDELITDRKKLLEGRGLNQKSTDPFPNTKGVQEKITDEDLKAEFGIKK